MHKKVFVSFIFHYYFVICSLRLMRFILLSGRTSTNNYMDVNNENENSSRCSGGTSMWFSSFRS
ncbi:hypothetical protein THOD04_40518 [Vibrio owensii]|nr:hypothetical protein THOD04_40518 [Vibrio owensii]